MKKLLKNKSLKRYLYYNMKQLKNKKRDSLLKITQTLKFNIIF